ncbi:MAG: hypothetical protein IJH37_10220 [Clostridia bacterium]|nr:hypothetical protein [Clostridia bacterium]
MINKDKEGRITDCHFLQTSGRRLTCKALVDFYNAADPRDQCGACPFYKTDKEFNEGWKRRRCDAKYMCFREAI